MKIKYYFLFSLGLLFFACGTSNNLVQENQNKGVNTGYTKVKASDNTNPSSTVSPNEGKPSNLQLSDMLRQVPGVRVTGSGFNVSVQVRGPSSFISGTQPLYVVNGTPLGTSYADVARNLNPNDIKDIRVLKGSDASIYGVRGANGVILIELK